MTIAFCCPNCGASNQLPEEPGGGKYYCQRCGTPLLVPPAAAGPPPARQEPQARGSSPSPGQRGAPGGKILVLAAVLALALSAGLIIWLVNREKEQGGIPTKEPEGFLVLEIKELNHDTFKEPLGSLDEELVDPPFVVEGGQVRFLDKIAHETDAEKLKKYGLRLGSAGVPPAKCRLLVVYSILYNGMGRQGADQEYQTFADLPAAIAIPKAATVDRFEYDPDKKQIPFPLAVNAIRFLPGGEKIDLKQGEGQSVQVDWAGITKSLKPGESAELASVNRTIPVVELPLMSEPVEPGKGPPLTLTPRIDHGPVHFTTTLSVTYHGVFPMGKEKTAKELLP